MVKTAIPPPNESLQESVMNVRSATKKFALAALAVATLVTGTLANNDKAHAADPGAFVAGAIIGGAAGLIAGSAHGHGYYHPRYAPTRRVCEFRERYNRWGHYIGVKRVCWREAIY
jgi:hypothetical protein